MKLTVRAYLVVLIALISVAVATSAAASTSASTSANSQRLYRIGIAVDTAELHVGIAKMATDERRAQARMSPCLTRAFVPIFEVVDAKSNANAGKALFLLSAEAGAQYEMASIKPILTPILNGVRSMLRLSLSAALRSSINDVLPAFARLESLNVCADARAWFAAGLARTREPRSTAETVVALAGIKKLTAATTRGAEPRDLTTAELRNRTLLKKRADSHIDALNKQANRSLQAWIEELIRGVERTVAASETTTTTTQTTTTATQTTTTATQTTTTAA
jgi:hypothetical protein